MKPKNQAKNYDKIADHWNGEEFNRENGIKQHHTGCLVECKFMTMFVDRVIDHV